MAVTLFEELMDANTKSSQKKSHRPVKESFRHTRKLGLNKIKLESKKMYEDDEDVEDNDILDVTDDDAEVVVVIDPEFDDTDEIPEEAAEDMIGDEVFKCPVCGANYVCDCDAEGNIEEDIETDEDGIPIECPVCGEEGEQILVGEIAPAEDVVDDDTEFVDDEGDIEDVDTDIDFDFEDGDVDIDVDEDEEEPAEEALRRRRAAQRRYESHRTPARHHSARRYESHRAPVRHISASHTRTEATHHTPAHRTSRPMPSRVRRYESTRPVTRTSRPVSRTRTAGRHYEINEQKFNALMNQIINENYKYSPKFSLRSATRKGNKLQLEYVVRERNNKVTRGTMVAEGYRPGATHMTLRIKDRGAFTKNYTKEPAFVCECVTAQNKINPQRISYNYRKKVNESIYRVKGSVGRSATTRTSRPPRARMEAAHRAPAHRPVSHSVHSAVRSEAVHRNRTRRVR